MIVNVYEDCGAQLRNRDVALADVVPAAERAEATNELNKVGRYWHWSHKETKLLLLMRQH